MSRWSANYLGVNVENEKWKGEGEKIWKAEAAKAGPKFCYRLEFFHFVWSRELFTQISWSIRILRATEEA